MITRNLYNKILKKNGSFASWAVWEPQGEKPKSNMGVHKVFNAKSNPALLASLRNDIVMVGLNFSRPLKDPPPFANFHDESPHANDFKIRYAFWETPYYGAYMTDVLKHLVILRAQSVRAYIRDHPDVIQRHIRAFEEELEDLESRKPMLLAFGRDAYDLLNKHLDKNRYSVLVPLTHYSHQVSKEKYRVDIHRQIAEALKEQKLPGRSSRV
jgi:hypothetical protein